jgi:hypothetical protein
LPLGSERRHVPSPGLLRNPTSPGRGRGERNKVHANSRTCSRGALVRPSFANHDDAKKDLLPVIKEGSGAPKGACQPCPRLRRQVCANLRHSSAARLRALSGHARLSALTLAALATGYHPDGSAPEPGFPPTNRAGVLPAWPFCRRLSTLRADRSFCRPTGDPEPPGSGLRAPPSLPSFRLALPERRPQ